MHVTVSGSSADFYPGYTQILLITGITDQKQTHGQV